MPEALTLNQFLAQEIYVPTSCEWRSCALCCWWWLSNTNSLEMWLSASCGTTDNSTCSHSGATLGRIQSLGCILLIQGLTCLMSTAVLHRIISCSHTLCHLLRVHLILVYCLLTMIPFGALSTISAERSSSSNRSWQLCILPQAVSTVASLTHRSKVVGVLFLVRMMTSISFRASDIPCATIHLLMSHMTWWSLSCGARLIGQAVMSTATLSAYLTRCVSSGISICNRLLYTTFQSSCQCLWASPDVTIIFHCPSQIEYTRAQSLK